MNNELILNLCLTFAGGIISGLLTTLIVVILRLFWIRVINPWIEEKLYSDAEIKGAWSGELNGFNGDDEDDDDSNMETMQQFYGMQIDRLQKKIVELTSRKKKKVKAIPPSQKIEPPAIKSDGPANSHDVPAPATVGQPITITNGSEAPLHPVSNIEKPTIEFEEDEEPEDEDDGNEIILDITRTGHKATGRMICVNGADKGQSYDLYGEFRNLLFTGTYQSFNKNNLDRGGFCLMLKGNGNVFEGFFSCYSDGDHSVSPFYCRLERGIKKT